MDAVLFIVGIINMVSWLLKLNLMIRRRLVCILLMGMDCCLWPPVEPDCICLDLLWHRLICMLVF